VLGLSSKNIKVIFTTWGAIGEGDRSYSGMVRSYLLTYPRVPFCILLREGVRDSVKKYIGCS
jgi:hypothetical protein